MEEPVVSEIGADDPSAFDRRRFLAMAAAIGAAAACSGLASMPSQAASTERRDLYPQGVASGDPDSRSVLLWTRRPFKQDSEATLHVQVADSPTFERLVVSDRVMVSAASDWTCRVLVGNLRPSTVYWYRFVDEAGNASRVGRTITAPDDRDPRPVRFAFVSCQNANLGEQHAYRRMIFDDEHAPGGQQLEFVVHLGDFFYELVWYPQDPPKYIFDRRVREIVRFANGEKIGEFYVPTTLDDYRSLYRAYLTDPDLQNARARWPFVSIWDNHEFSISGWQSLQIFDGKNRPAQTCKVAANQAWFEFQPARVTNSSGHPLRQFAAPRVEDKPISEFDANGFGNEPNNRAAVGSLTGYRALRWGRHVDLILTDQRSYRSEEPVGRNETKALTSAAFPELFPQEALEILDAGHAYAGGNPPATLRFGEHEIPNFRKNDPPQTVLGAPQKHWFLQRLKASKATWKIWGNTLGTLDFRVDPQNLPVGLTTAWPGGGFAGFRAGDSSTAYVERAEIYNLVRDEKITGFVTIAGDRHSFWAGLAASALPPQPFQPVGVVFITGSISAPGTVEKMEHGFPKDHPLRSLYILRKSADSKPEPTVNMLLKHGVRACLEYERTGDAALARKASNPDLSPHLAFLDLGGHGYSIVSASHDFLECEFVCIPRPLEPVKDEDGGPVLYRVVHRTPLWNKGQPPTLEQRVLAGNPTLSL